MGSKRGASSPPAPPSSPPPECCMCGDRGLSRELFRCKSCQFRHQHKYCSDLYPKAESYRACNWCLKEGGGGKSTDNNNSSPISSSTSTDDNNNNNGSTILGISPTVKLQRGAFATHLSKPVKKPPPPPPPPSSSGGRRLRQGLVRGKVRRYKLLEEVSS